MLKLKVSGMTCGHCVSAVTSAVRSVPGVEDVSVDPASGALTVVGHPDEQAVRDAIVEEGYEVQPLAA